jgi:hypothetical protein
VDRLVIVSLLLTGLLATQAPNSRRGVGDHLTEGDTRMATPASATRLIFAYDSSGIRLVAQQPVDLAVPSAEAESASSDELAAGFWVEVRDDRRNVLYRHPMRDPIQRYPEVFSDDPDQTIARVEDPAPSGAFTVVVPALPEGERVALMSASAAPATPSAEAAPVAVREIAEFPLLSPAAE